MKLYLGIGQGAVRDRAEAELAPARREDPQVCQDDREADVGLRDSSEAASVCQVQSYYMNLNNVHKCSIFAKFVQI